MKSLIINISIGQNPFLEFLVLLGNPICRFQNPNLDLPIKNTLAIWRINRLIHVLFWPLLSVTNSVVIFFFYPLTKLYEQYELDHPHSVSATGVKYFFWHLSILAPAIYFLNNCEVHFDAQMVLLSQESSTVAQQTGQLQDPAHIGNLEKKPAQLLSAAIFQVPSVMAGPLHTLA